MKKQQSYKTALCGVISALSLVLMFLTGVIPVMSYALPAIAGAVLIAIVIELNIKWALLSYVAVGLLAIFISPDKESALLFIAFLGYYPIIKAYIEKIRTRILEWIAKLTIFNLAVFVSYQLLKYVLNMSEILEQISEYSSYGIPILILVANAVFVIYDIAMTGVISTYYNTIRPKISRYLK